MNKKIPFNDGWEFAKNSLGVSNPKGLNFEPVDLPHDWLIYNTFIGWYRKSVTYYKKEDQILLCFDGVYMDSSLYINEQFIGEWKYGYSSFEHEITHALVEGENEILVKVVYQSPMSRWYSGAGIYCNVWLKTRDKNHIITDRNYISTEQKAQGWEVEIETEMNILEEVELTHPALYKNQIIATTAKRVVPNDQSHLVNKQTLLIENPSLWSTEHPELYQVNTQLYLTGKSYLGNQKKKQLELVSQNMGLRTVTLDTEQGFMLNGEKMKLNGVCEYHDLGAIGAAFNKTALRRRFRLLKERFHGITSICFVLIHKIHIKGFSFKKYNRAFEQNFAADCDHI